MVNHLIGSSVLWVDTFYAMFFLTFLRLKSESQQVLWASEQPRQSQQNQFSSNLQTKYHKFATVNCPDFWQTRDMKCLKLCTRQDFVGGYLVLPMLLWGKSDWAVLPFQVPPPGANRGSAIHTKGASGCRRAHFPVEPASLPAQFQDSSSYGFWQHCGGQT